MAQIDAISEQINFCLNSLGKRKWVDITTDLATMPAAKELINKHRVKFSSGKKIDWTYIESHNNSARGVEMYEKDQLNRHNAGLRPSIPWRHANSSFIIDKHEVSTCNNESEILDIVKLQRWKEMTSMAEYIETKFWSCPSDSTSKDFFGLPYWCFTQVESTAAAYSGNFATAGAGAFLNLNKTGFTSGPGDISRVTYGRTGNWNCQYTSVTKDDLLTKMRRGAFETDWQSAVDHPDYKQGSGGRAIYSAYTTLASAERLAEQQNETLGSDLSKMTGKVRFQGNPWRAVPYIQQNLSTMLPVYQIDWNVFYFVVLNGWNFKETDLPMVPEYHNCFGHFTDITCNTRCENPHKLAVYSAA